MFIIIYFLSQEMYARVSTFRAIAWFSLEWMINISSMQLAAIYN